MCLKSREIAAGGMTNDSNLYLWRGVVSSGALNRCVGDTQNSTFQIANQFIQPFIRALQVQYF